MRRHDIGGYGGFTRAIWRDSPATPRPPPRPLTRRAMPKCSTIAATVRRVAAARAAAALRAAPL
eukprot:1240917-Prymnesium_polylepis.1